MKQFIKKYFAGLIPLRYLGVFLRHPGFLKNFFRYRKNVKEKEGKPLFRDIQPFVNDKTQKTPFDTHYIYHTAWAVRKVKQIAPPKHIDISSTLYFCTTLSAFIPTEFYDFRPAQLQLSGLVSKQADLTRLSFETGSIGSLSCMHTVEHIGLGRYGDPIQPGGDIIAMKELQRVLKKGGHLLFVTPVGKPKIVFNGHRVYSYEQIIQVFDELTLVEFSLIPDNAIEQGMIEQASPELVQTQHYGCGCFWFQKPGN
jgi:SAM-dependent methyltransferase